MILKRKSRILVTMLVIVTLSLAGTLGGFTITKVQTAKAQTSGGGWGQSTSGDKSNNSVFPDPKKPDSANRSFLKTLVNNLLMKIMGVAGVILLVMVLIGAVIYAVSAGDPNMAGLGKKTIIGAVIGLVIIIMSYTMIALTISLFKAGGAGGGSGGSGSTTGSGSSTSGTGNRGGTSTGSGNTGTGTTSSGGGGTAGGSH